MYVCVCNFIVTSGANSVKMDHLNIQIFLESAQQREKAVEEMVGRRRVGRREDREWDKGRLRMENEMGSQ